MANRTAAEQVVTTVICSAVIVFVIFTSLRHTSEAPTMPPAHLGVVRMQSAFPDHDTVNELELNLYCKFSQVLGWRTRFGLDRQVNFDGNCWVTVQALACDREVFGVGSPGMCTRRTGHEAIPDWAGFVQNLKAYCQSPGAEYYVAYGLNNAGTQYYGDHRPTAETLEASVMQAVRELVALAAGWVEPRMQGANPDYSI